MKSALSKKRVMSNKNSKNVVNDSMSDANVEAFDTGSP
jgi:hypothetical protein